MKVLCICLLQVIIGRLWLQFLADGVTVYGNFSRKQSTKAARPRRPSPQMPTRAPFTLMVMFDEHDWPERSGGPLSTCGRRTRISIHNDLKIRRYFCGHIKVVLTRPESSRPRQVLRTHIFWSSASIFKLPLSTVTLIMQEYRIL